MADYLACDVCRTLNNAGFSKGWRLPTQATQGSGDVRYRQKMAHIVLVENNYGT